VTGETVEIITSTSVEMASPIAQLIQQNLQAAGPERAATLRAACARIAQNANIIPLVSKDTIVAYRSDKVSAVIPRTEGYAVPLRRLADFSVR
jgi:peptide/nickel transport system substrate-binding protein